MAKPSTSLPSFESLWEPQQLVVSSRDMLHVRWKPFGPLITSIMVIEDLSNASSAQQPYQTDDATFHHISVSALTKPPVSSITVKQLDLEEWPSNWFEDHIPHADYGEKVVVWKEVYGDEPADGGFGVDINDNRAGNLMECCGCSRPRPTPSVVVKASTQPFVTIHDFVTTVHPWLQTVRDDILEARGGFPGEPLPLDTLLYVSPFRINELRLVEGDCDVKYYAEAYTRRVNGVLQGYHP